jgi:predicted ATPase
MVEERIRISAAIHDLEHSMIESIEFTNFKALRKTTLPLAPFTLLLGPNGSGKTTVLQALQFAASFAGQEAFPNGELKQKSNYGASLLSVNAEDPDSAAKIKLRLVVEKQIALTEFQLFPNGGVRRQLTFESGRPVDPAHVNDDKLWLNWLSRMQTFSLDASAIAQPFVVSSRPLQWNGMGLAAVLDDLHDNHKKRWNSFLGEMCRWLPEYDDIGFDKPNDGQKAINLRTKSGGHRISAKELSQGTLIALALLTLAYLPEPPSLIGLEEIDRGLHPRLLRHLQDALYRLAYPESCGEKRPPIQVIATTHSPYLLDLYRDHPEEVVLAQKAGLEVEMKRLTDIDHYEDILGDSPLSEVWYSGVLGGAAVKP